MRKTYKFVLIPVILFAVIALMSSCKDTQPVTAVTSIQNLLATAKSPGEAEPQCKALHSIQICAVEAEDVAEKNNIRLITANFGGRVNVFTPGDECKFAVTPFDTSAER